METTSGRIFVTKVAKSSTSCHLGSSLACVYFENGWQGAQPTRTRGTPRVNFLCSSSGSISTMSLHTKGASLLCAKAYLHSVSASIPQATTKFSRKKPCERPPAPQKMSMTLATGIEGPCDSSLTERLSDLGCDPLLSGIVWDVCIGLPCECLKQSATLGATVSLSSQTRPMAT